MYFPERSESELLEMSTLTPHQWAIKNLFTIQSSINTYLQIKHKDKPYLKNDARLSREKRALSEMPICYAVKNVVDRCGTPTGFEITEGRIMFTDADDMYYDYPHVYFKEKTLNDPNDADDIIACLFTAQTIASTAKTLSKGQRIDALQEKAAKNFHPGLVHVLNSEITLVMGTRNQIHVSLGVLIEDDVDY